MNNEALNKTDISASSYQNGKRGKLTIFLGAAAGVGKTYAMLESAHERISEGIDVAAGWIETHGGRETEALLAGLPVISPRYIESPGKIVQALDIDAVLKRRPEVVLIDDLAYVNFPGSRHPYRYLDIEEILENNIDVYTTFNIQNLESLNDTVAQITGIRVKETVPDRFFENADQIKLIDISADELIRRLREGKVDIPDTAGQGGIKFFRPGNINALRELALRQAARSVGKQTEEYRNRQGIIQPWPVQERVMACISSSPFAVHVLRRARQIANDLGAELIAVHVDPLFSYHSNKSLANLMKNIQLADELGAKVITLNSQDISSGILNLARQFNVSQIILGKPLKPRWKEIIKPSVVDDIIRNSAGIGIYVIPGDPSPKEANAKSDDSKLPIEKNGWSLFLSFLMVLFVTFIGAMFGSDLGLTNIGMLYLLPVVFSSARLGAVPSVIVAFISVILFDVFFIPPILRLSVDDLRYLITFVVFITVAFTTGSIAERLRFRIRDALHRETRTRALYDLARGLSAVSDMELLASRVVNHISETLDAEVVLYLPDKNDQLKIVSTSKPFSDLVLAPNEQAVAEWSYRQSQRSGLCTDTLSGAKGFYLPVKTEDKTLGVLGVKPNKRLFTPEQINLLEALAGLSALAITRLNLSAHAQEIKTLEESERLRAALFNSISHEMKTPLASIMGAVSSLVEDGDLYNTDQKASLLMSIKQGAFRMNRVVNNLLDMARLESGYMRLHTDWCDIQDIIGVSLRENHEALQEHQIKVMVPDGIRLIKVDYALIEQVLTNLLHNAAKYSPVQSEILVRVYEEENELIVSVADQGNGIPQEDAERIFNKFYRLQSQQNISGTGLGLSICRGIIEAHGGRIWARNRSDSGSIFSFALPIDGGAARSTENTQEG